MVSDLYCSLSSSVSILLFYPRVLELTVCVCGHIRFIILVISRKYSVVGQMAQEITGGKGSMQRDSFSFF